MIEKFYKLIDEYKKQHPNAESPENWMMQFDLETLIEMLENANGKQISVIETPEQDDGGILIYI